MRWLILSVFFSSVSFVSAADTPRTNIVLVLADDLGYGDLACYGATDLETPNLDRFASDGVRLTSCYAGHPNCSPSRTALMTGRTPTRVGVRNWIPQDSPVHLRASEVSIASLLKQAGYDTCHVGKWHLNGEFNQPTQPQPSDHGFNHWFSTQNNALPSHHNPDNFVRNGKPVGELQGYSAELVVNEGIEWLTKLRDKSKPFFMYVCFHEPHEPIASAEEFTKRYPSADPSYSAHHGNITQMDHAFGRLMKVLEEQDLTETTFVFFTSDNGPAITPQHPHGSAGPLRDKKGSVYEGGIRVPGMVRWPGRVQGGKVSDIPVSGVDFLPTACNIAGIEPPADRTLDGTNFLAALEAQPLERITPLYWHFNRASGEKKVALRSGDWKILAALNKSLSPRSNNVTEEDEQTFKTSELTEFALYDLRADIAESTNLSQEAPEKFAELKAALEKKYHEVRAESPTWPAWEFTNAEGKRIQRPNYTKKKKTIEKEPERQKRKQKKGEPKKSDS